uniref:Uncharacterized protein n=1 Tax=Rhizophora mucronata TaxID=61149 RepID=A0A2P2N7E7_RHIMU
MVQVDFIFHFEVLNAVETLLDVIALSFM